MSWRVQIDEDIYKDVSGSGGSTSIPEVTTDPVSPTAQQAWVLHTSSGGSGSGSALGLLLALTNAGSGGSDTYQFSYYTTEGTTVRATLA